MAYGWVSRCGVLQLMSASAVAGSNNVMLIAHLERKTACARHA